MEVQFVSAESAYCPLLKIREGHEEHIAQSHFPIASLPGPAESLNIAQFPTEIHCKAATFDLRGVANLWLQLLVIQVQNGNFWNYEDVIKSHQAPLVRKKFSNPPPRLIPTTLGIIDDPNPTILDLKSVLYLRHKLQKGLLNYPSTVPIADVMPEMSDFLARFEKSPDLDANVIRHSKIHKVLIAICRISTDLIPENDEFHFRRRCETQLTRMRDVIANHQPVENLPDAIQNNRETPQIEEEVVVSDPLIPDDADQIPPVCITQVTPDDCDRIKSLARQCNPPLDLAVVELLCLLPRFSSKLNRGPYQIGFMSNIFDTVGELELGGRRKFGGWGPDIPPHVLQLTAFSEGSYGTALYLDTTTGEGVIFEEYQVVDPDKRDPNWDQLIGERKPIEEILQGWIASYLYGTLLPSGKGAVWDEGPRYLSARRLVSCNPNRIRFPFDAGADRHQDFLKHKSLFGEFGWPQAFPLQAPHYHDFLRRQHRLFETTFNNNPNETYSFARQWMEAVHDWVPNHPSIQDNDEVHQHELYSALNSRVKEALDYHQRRVEDRQYALASDVPTQENLRQPLSLGSSAHIGDTWRVDVSPKMVLERFEEVFARSPRAKDEDTLKMREILQGAYERRQKEDQGIYESDFWDEPDDDSTSDYDPDQDIEEDGDEEYETDEAESDIVGEDLMRDAETDIESLRFNLERYRIGDGLD